MRDNYKNPKTGETFHIPKVRSKYNSETRSMEYYNADTGKVLEDNGVLLVPYIDSDYYSDGAGSAAIFTPTKNRV